MAEAQIQSPATSSLIPPITAANDAAIPFQQASNVAIPSPPPPTRQPPPPPAVTAAMPTTSTSTARTTMQAQQAANIAGAPARQYLNEFVTPYLLEGMKLLVKEQPAKPLEVLGRFLLEKSSQIDTMTANANNAMKTESELDGGDTKMSGS